MKLIGLCGRRGSGKDEVCKAILEMSPTGRRLAFADPLKEELAGACGVSVRDIEIEKPRYRLGLQWWGTEFRRGQSDRYWLDRAQERLDQFAAQGVGFVVITDVRFPNEVEFVLANGGVLAWVDRPLAVVDGHASEALARETSRASYTIPNHGDLSDLHNAARWLARLQLGDLVALKP